MQSAWREANRRVCRVYAGEVFLLLILVLCGQVTGSDVRAVPCTIGAPGQTGESAIILDQVSLGLSEFEVEVTLIDPAIGEITGVRFPSWAGLNSKSRIPSDSVIIKAADIGRKVYPGASEVVLAILTIRGDEPGDCDVCVKVLGMRDEVGSPYTIEGRNGTLSVIGSIGVGDYPDMPDPAVPFTIPFTTVPTLPVTTSTIPSINPEFPVQEMSLEPTPSPTMGNDSREMEFENTESGVIQGSFCIDSTPSGAVVFADGDEAGSTPVCINLPAGTHEILLSSREGFTWQGEIMVTAGQILSLPPIILNKPVYIIKTSAGPHGTVFPSGKIEVIGGGGVEVYFTADPGYRLDGVQIDGVWQESSSNVFFESVSANHTVNGTFSPAPVPVSSFSANVTEGYSPLVVGFQSLSTGDITALSWNFGDDSISPENAPVHIYEQPGEYTVTLEVCGDGGCRIMHKDDMITVREREPSVANFSANVTEGYFPLVVGFQSLSTGDITALFWNFGDDSISPENAPVHIYEQPGEYTVTLEVCGDGGCRITHKDDMITVREREPSVANFSANVTEGYFPLVVGFQSLSTGDITALSWNFGDDSISPENAPVHIYEQPGEYTVTLEVCGDGGCVISQGEGLIVVKEREHLRPNFTVNSTIGEAPLMVQFDDLSTGSPDSWIWDFGDGSRSTDPSPVHIYELPGIYSVSLTVANDRYTSFAEKEGLIEVTPVVVGGSIGYIQIQCQVEGARVFFDGQFKGEILNGTLTIPVYVTATPFKTIYVKASGFLPNSVSLITYPGEGETIILQVPLVATRTVNNITTRFEIPFTPTNTTHLLPSLMM